jgi:hypothetical protein
MTMMTTTTATTTTTTTHQQQHDDDDGGDEDEDKDEDEDVHAGGQSALGGTRLPDLDGLHLAHVPQSGHGGDGLSLIVEFAARKQCGDGVYEEAEGEARQEEGSRTVQAATRTSESHAKCSTTTDTPPGHRRQTQTTHRHRTPHHVPHKPTTHADTPTTLSAHSSSPNGQRTSRR